VGELEAVLSLVGRLSEARREAAEREMAARAADEAVSEAKPYEPSDEIKVKTSSRIVHAPPQNSQNLAKNLPHLKLPNLKMLPSGCALFRCARSLPSKPLT
jgi:hypothetical protein